MLLEREAVVLKDFKIFIVCCPKAVVITRKKCEGNIILEAKGSMLAPSL